MYLWALNRKDSSGETETLDEIRISRDRSAYEDFKKARNQVRRRLPSKAVKLKKKDISMSAKKKSKNVLELR